MGRECAYLSAILSVLESQGLELMTRTAHDMPLICFAVGRFEATKRTVVMASVNVGLDFCVPMAGTLRFQI
jgi:hypothetical protein